MAEQKTSSASNITRHAIEFTTELLVILQCISSYNYNDDDMMMMMMMTVPWQEAQLTF